jgi:hypothetical protein
MPWSPSDLDDDAVVWMPGTVVPGTPGYIKVYNGSSWEEKPVKVWNGTTWEIKPVKFWDGFAWVLA